MEKLRSLETALGQAIRGKPEAVRLSLVCLLARGHLLIEDVPGVGKTTLGQALARAVDCSFHRLQFTSDMLPSDVLGVTVYNAHTREFEFKRGPIFTNFLLADEINRTTPKTSQLDRFLLRLRIGYPDAVSEREILRGAPAPAATAIKPVLSGEDVVRLQERVPTVRVEEALTDYMMAVVEKTRAHEALSLGVSPRGAQALFRAAQALALLEGRDFAIPDDVKRLVVPVFAHRVVINTRIALTQRGTDAADRILEEILTLVDVPL